MNNLEYRQLTVILLGLLLAALFLLRIANQEIDNRLHRSPTTVIYSRP